MRSTCRLISDRITSLVRPRSTVWQTVVGTIAVAVAVSSEAGSGLPFPPCVGSSGCPEEPSDGSEVGGDDGGVCPLSLVSSGWDEVAFGVVDPFAGVLD